ncbi:MAG: hypothetical protein P8X52_11920 [Limibacillus sp.]
MSRRKVMIYVQHLLGIGHIRRASVIAKAVAAAGHDCVFVSGGLPQPDLDLGGARLEQLPPAYCRDERFELLDEAGEPIGEAWKEERRARLLALYERERPDALLIEQYPLAAARCASSCCRCWTEPLRTARVRASTDRSEMCWPAASRPTRNAGCWRRSSATSMRSWSMAIPPSSPLGPASPQRTGS